MDQTTKVRCRFGILTDPHLKARQVAWGWRISSESALERDEHEQNVVAVARHMRENGLRAIVEVLGNMGVVGRRGKPICTTRVFEMMHAAGARSGGMTLPTPLWGPRSRRKNDF